MKQVTMEKKLVDWELAFNSSPNVQENQALQGLIDGLKSKMRGVTPGVVA